MTTVNQLNKDAPSWRNELEELRAELHMPRSASLDQVLERACSRIGLPVYTVSQARAALSERAKVQADIGAAAMAQHHYKVELSVREYWDVIEALGRRLEDKRQFAELLIDEQLRAHYAADASRCVRLLEHMQALAPELGAPPERPGAAAGPELGAQPDQAGAARELDQAGAARELDQAGAARELDQAGAARELDRAVMPAAMDPQPARAVVGLPPRLTGAAWVNELLSNRARTVASARALDAITSEKPSAKPSTRRGRHHAR